MTGNGEKAGPVPGRMCVDDTLAAAMTKAGLPSATRHLFFCIGPDCCATPEGQRTWEYAKARLGELGLDVMRTKAACFRLCERGPWLLVYPDGVWYPAVTPERFERILQQHLVNGEIVQEWVAAVQPLNPPAPK